jgi:signal transduction histidine kinase
VELVVPRLADYCTLHLLDARGQLQSCHVGHWDEEKARLARKVEQEYPASAEGSGGLAQVIRTGQSLLYERIDPEQLKQAARSPEHLEFLQQMGLHSVMVVPLTARGRRLGVLTFVSAESRQEYGPLDLAVAEDLANLAALSVDNARLHDAELEARLDAEEALERMARLQSVTAALSRALPRGQVLEVIVREALSALGAVAGGVVEISDGAHEFRLLHSMGFSEETRRRYALIPANERYPLTESAATKMPVFLESPEEWLARYPNPEPERLTFDDGAWAVLPFLVGDQLTGALTLAFPTRRVFSETDRQFMAALASQCAQALERGRLFDAELQARAEAESASRAKSQFLAVMSHELRTPLTAIIGYADLLHSEVSGPLSSKQKVQLERMRASAWHLLQLISEILSLTRIEAGREQIDARPVQLNDLARECIAVVHLQAQQKRLEPRLEVPHEPVTLITDPGKVRQILLNLLANAVKFTEAGEIGLRLEPTDNGGAAFIVSDTGPGIPDEHLESIFDAFTQVDQSMTRVFGGAGLGLSVSRRLANLLDAKLTVASTVGKGSTFTLTLPPLLGDSESRRIAY